MKIPKQVRYFNKRFPNQLTTRIAHDSWGPFSIVYHVGRRSGKPYETPIFVFPTVDGFVVALTYGPEVDWFRNVSAAGRCRILWHRHEYGIEKIDPLDSESALPLIPRFIRMSLQLMGMRDFVRMRY
ncbi:MAG: nitroreductase family deazaflavin-dependent oxidoreductase [Anaerolineales bacterium]|jgi:deazaflavin-dependent oxidoreductase (nitroreductase family)